MSSLTILDGNLIRDLAAVGGFDLLMTAVADSDFVQGSGCIDVRSLM